MSITSYTWILYVCTRYTKTQEILGSEYEVKLAGGDEDAATEYLRGSDLRLLPLMNARQLYEARVTKIKLTVQFVQICMRINVTYRSVTYCSSKYLYP
jgi:hypothetical protein